MSHESAAHAKAAASFQQALRFRPDDVAALVWLGEMQPAQDQPELAERSFASALAFVGRVFRPGAGETREPHLKMRPTYLRARWQMPHL